MSRTELVATQRPSANTRQMIREELDDVELQTENGVERALLDLPSLVRPLDASNEARLL